MRGDANSSGERAICLFVPTSFKLTYDEWSQTDASLIDLESYAGDMAKHSEKLLLFSCGWFSFEGDNQYMYRNTYFSPRTVWNWESRVTWTVWN